MRTFLIFLLGYSGTMCVGIMALAQWMVQLEAQEPGSAEWFRKWWKDRPPPIKILETMIAWAGGIVAIIIFR